MKRFLKLHTLLLVLTLPLLIRAQHGQLEIKLDKQQVMPGDTLVVQAAYTINGVAPKTATLFLNIVHDNGATWKMRWPLLDGKSANGITISDSIPFGNCRLYFSAVPAFFAVKGKVNNPSGLTSLKTLLITADGAFTQRDVAVSRQGYFEYANNLFPGQASLVFSRNDGGNNDNLDISVNTILDSLSLTSGTMAKRQITLGIRKGATVAEDTLLVAADTALLGKAKTLSEVRVFAQKKTPMEAFNERYVTGWFSSAVPRVVYDLTDNPADASAVNLVDYLRGKAGMLVFGESKKTKGETVVTWWNEGVTFYINEIRTTLREIASISIRNVAYIKMFPPPFFGNELAGGGAVAIYTRREFNGDYENGNKSKFRVNGYSPLIVNMSATPDGY